MRVTPMACRRKRARPAKSASHLPCWVGDGTKQALYWGASSAKRLAHFRAHLKSLRADARPQPGQGAAGYRFKTFSVACYIFDSCLRFIGKR